MKKTVVAIGLAMFITACSSGGSSSSQPSPRSQNPESAQPVPPAQKPKSEQPKQELPKSEEQPKQPQPPVEPLKPEEQPNQPQPPVAPPESEQQPNQPQPPAEPPKPEQQSNQPQPPAEPPKSEQQPEQPKPPVTPPETEQQDQPQPPAVPPKQEQKEQLKPPAPPKRGPSVVEWEGEREIDLQGGSLSDDYTPLPQHAPPVNGGLDVSSKNIEVNLNKLSENGLGWNQGVFTKEDNPNLTVNDSTNGHQLNYVFVHQPYSYYGVLYDNNKEERLDNYQRGQFFAGVSAKAPVEKPTGSASYQSMEDGVIAHIEYIGTDRQKGNALKPDGSVTLTANFDKDTVSGTLNSELLGNVELSEGNLNNREFFGSTSAKEGVTAGKYRGSFSPNYQDVVGYINNITSKNDKGEFIYSAIFGATKQK